MPLRRSSPRHSAAESDTASPPAAAAAAAAKIGWHEEEEKKEPHGGVSSSHGYSMSSSGSRSVAAISQIRHALDESTRCVSPVLSAFAAASFFGFGGGPGAFAAGNPGRGGGMTFSGGFGGANDFGMGAGGGTAGGGGGFPGMIGSTAPLSCPAGYLSYSPYHRRWDVFYRSLSLSPGSVMNMPTLVAHAHRVVLTSSSNSNSATGGQVMQRVADDGSLAPPPKVLRTTLRMIELRRMLELVGARGGALPRVQTRQMTVVSLEGVLADLAAMEENGGDGDDDDESSQMQSLRYVKLLRSAGAEAIRMMLSSPVECRARTVTGTDGDVAATAVLWRVVLSEAYESQLPRSGGSVSPTGSRCSVEQIDYARRFVRDCLALGAMEDSDLDLNLTLPNMGNMMDIYGDRKMPAAPTATAPSAAASTADVDAEEDEYDSDVQIIDNPNIAIAAEAAAAATASKPSPPATPASTMSLTSTGRRPKRMRESVRRSPTASLDGDRFDTAAATVAATASNGNGAKRVKSSSPQLLKSPDKDGKKIQLYASTFGTPQADQGRCEDSGRPKRKIKQVIRFNADPLPYKVQRSVAATAATGDGFNCPACREVVSYDATQCPACHLRCQYAPGAGVQIIKERGEVLTNASDGIKRDKAEAAVQQASGQPSGEGKRVLRVRPKRTDSSTKDAPAPIIESSSQLRENHICSKCGKSFLNNAGLGMHKRTCSGSLANKRAKSEATKVKPRRSKSVSPAPAAQPKRITNFDNLPVSAQRVFAVAPGIVECEACLKLFSQSSIQGHRRRLHGLRADQLACAHCLLTFPTKEERHEHIRKKHPGKPVGVDPKIIAQHRMYQYICPCCSKGAFSLVDLETHLTEVHSTTLDRVRRDVLWLCPFCPSGRGRKRSVFPDHQSLKEHREERHEDCHLLGAILFVPGCKRSKEKKSRSKSPTPYAGTAEQPMRYYGRLKEEADSEDEDEEYEAKEDAVDISFVLHRLSVKPVDLLASSSISTELLTSNPSVSDIRTTVDTTIEALEEKIEASELSDESLEKEYTEEGRLYTRTIRERSGKAESEKLEKEKFQVICDEQQMMWEYQNRGKKRSANALEEEALLLRPIKYEKKIASISMNNKRGACSVGEGCRLCNGFHASELVTEAEMNEAGGDIEKIIPISFGRAKAGEGKTLMPMSQQLMPDIKEIDVDDYLADSDDEQEKSKAKEKDTDTRPSRRKQKAEDALAELGHLCRLRHTLAFVDEYNRTLLPAISRNPKNYHV